MAVLLSVVLVALLVPLAGYGAITFVRGGVAAELQRAADAGALAGAASIPLSNPDAVQAYLDAAGLPTPGGVDAAIAALVPDGYPDPRTIACRVALDALTAEASTGFGRGFGSGTPTCVASYIDSSPRIGDLTDCLDALNRAPSTATIPPLGVPATIPVPVLPTLPSLPLLGGRAMAGALVAAGLPIPTAAPSPSLSPSPLPSPTLPSSAPSLPVLPSAPVSTSPTPVPTPTPLPSTPPVTVPPPPVAVPLLTDLLPNLKSLLPVLVTPGVQVDLTWGSVTPLDGLVAQDGPVAQQSSAQARRVPKNLVVVPVLSPLLVPGTPLPPSQEVDLNPQVAAVVSLTQDLVDDFDGYLGTVVTALDPVVPGVRACGRLLNDDSGDLQALVNPDCCGAPTSDQVLADAQGAGSPVLVVGATVNALGIPFFDFFPVCVKSGSTITTGVTLTVSPGSGDPVQAGVTDPVPGTASCTAATPGAFRSVLLR